MFLPDCDLPFARGTQLLALELVAKSRFAGLVSSEASKLIDVAPRNFFYISKVWNSSLVLLYFGDLGSAK